jgi:hypothetical protein
MRTSTLHAVALSIALIATVLGPVASPVAAAAAPAFTAEEFTATVGETAVVTVELPAGADRRVDFHVGSERVNYRLDATLVDENGDGAVTVELDTRTAGRLDPASYLSAAGPDSVENATQSSERLPERLDPGTYPLSLGPRDGPWDTASLVLEPGDPPATATVTSVPTATPTGPPRLDPAVVTVQRGETAEVLIRFPGRDADRVTLTVGSSAAGYRANVTVVDADGDGSATVGIDTGAANESAPRGHFTVSAGDRLESPAVSAAEPSLAPDDYDLTLVRGETVVNIGTLVVRDAPETTGVGTTAGSGTETEMPGFAPAVAGVGIGVAAALFVRR